MISTDPNTDAIQLAIFPCPDALPDQPTARSYYRSSGQRPCLRGRTARTSRGKSWRPASTSRPPRRCWLSAESWIAALGVALDTDTGREIRSQKGWVKTQTVLDVAAVDARAANGRTGRGVSTSHRHVSSQLRCSEKTVKRARQVIEILGFAVVVDQGRRLTREERAQAWKYHRGRQVNIASERALVVPRPERQQSHLARQLVPLSRRDSVCTQESVATDRPTRAHARVRPNKHNPSPRPRLSVQRLAAELVSICPDLAGNHIGSLCRALERLGLDDKGWTGRDIVEEISRYNKLRGLFEPRVQHNPVGLFIHQMRGVLNHVDEPPKQRRAREWAEYRALREAKTASIQAAERRNKELAEDPARQARIREILAEGRRRRALH